MKDPRPPVFRLHAESILEDFGDVFSSDFSKSEPKHGVEHDIVNVSTPVSCWPRRLSPERLKQVRDEFLKMKEMGLIRCSSSA